MRSPRVIPGISEPLPEGERLLWSGGPSVGVQLRRGAALRVGAAWLVLAGALPILLGLDAPGSTAAHLAWVAVVGVALVGMSAGFAWLVACTTSYAVTDRRVVLQIGIALPAVLNIPLHALEGAMARAHRDGSGDIYLPLSPKSERPGYGLLWPHARPWRLGHPQPGLRWLEDVSAPARALKEAALERSEFVPGDPTPARRTGPAHPTLPTRLSEPGAHV